MADGDEKIDHNDRVLVLNRMSDAVVEVIHDGRTLAWKAGEVKSIQRNLAFDHYIRKSRVYIDPTGENPGVYALVIVNEAREPITADGTVDPATPATPLTAAYCKELRKHGFLDTSNLSPDRQFGGDHSMQLIDPESGQHPTQRENRGGISEGPIPRAPGLPASDRSLTGSALDTSGAAPE